VVVVRVEHLQLAPHQQEDPVVEVLAELEPHLERLGQSILVLAAEVEEMMELQQTWVVMVLLVVPVSSSSPTLHKYLKNHNGISW
jgi:hypothetical protein